MIWLLKSNFISFGTPTYVKRVKRRFGLGMAFFGVKYVQQGELVV